MTRREIGRTGLEVTALGLGGAPFGNLDQLQIGDLIEVGTLAGVYKYSVTGTLAVEVDENADALAARLGPAGLALLAQGLESPDAEVRRRVAGRRRMRARRPDEALRRSRLPRRHRPAVA